MKTKKSKSIIALLFSVMFLVPVMFALTGCGGALEQKATCNTNQRYTESSAEEFDTKTTGTFPKVSSMVNGYRLTLESNAEGYVGPEGYQTKYSLSNYANAIVRCDRVNGDNLGLKTVTEYDIVGLKGKVTTESYVKDNNLFIHTFPTTVESNYATVQVPEQKLLIENLKANEVLTKIGGVDSALEDSVIIDFVKENSKAANFKICENGKNIGFKVVFDESVSYSGMTNLVVYVNVNAESAHASNGYMIEEVRIEGNYSITAGAGVAGSSITMNGRMSVTFSPFPDEISYPSFDGYKVGSLSDIKSFN